MAEVALKNLTVEIAANRLELFANEGRLVQHTWHKRNGKDLACLLGSFHEDISSPQHCPAQVMPEWCALLVVTLFDRIPAENIFDTGKRFAAALRSTASFPTTKWDSIRRKFLHATITQALDAVRSVESKLNKQGKTAWAQVQEACGDILLTFAQDKDDPTKEQREKALEARRVAYAAAYATAAATTTAYATAHAAAAAYAAAHATAYAAAAAEAAADTAAAAAAAAAAEAAADTAAARPKTNQRLFDTLITTITELFDESQRATRVDSNISDLFFNRNLDDCKVFEDGKFVEFDIEKLKIEAHDFLDSLARLGVAVPAIDTLIADFLERV